MSRTTIIILVIGLVFLIGVGVAMYRLNDAGKREVVNQYRGSQFSITYPLELELEEYANGSLSIGSTTTEGFRPAVELTIATPVGDAVSADFETFLLAQMKLLCNATESGESVSCNDVERSRAFSTKNGENTTEYYLTLISRPVAGGEVVTKSFGPIYTYVLPPREEDAASAYAALIVYTPLASVLAGNADQALLTRINDSVTIGGGR